MKAVEGSLLEPNRGGALDAAIAQITEKGLAAYLVDVDLAKHVVTWLRDELGIPHAVGKVLVKALAVLVTAAAQGTTGWLAGIARREIHGLFSALPLYSKFARNLGRLVAFLDKELRAKAEACDIIAGHRPPHSAEFTHELTLDLRAHLRQINGISELSLQIADGFARLEASQNPQPALVLRLLKESCGNLNRFYYGTQKVPFLGRDAELRALDDFLSSDRIFSWWLMVGPGGLGKSRLALELCLRRGMAWRAGFLPSDYCAADFRHWRPTQPTLLVADYAAHRADELGAIARRLWECGQDLVFPVRLLLLERQSVGLWLEKFQGAGGDAHVIRDAYHNEQPLQVGPLSQDTLWQLITFLLEDAKAVIPDRELTLARLREIDPEGRPLFAALLADALAAGRQLRHWDQDLLLQDVLRREEQKHWGAVTLVEKDLLALATMCGGVNPHADDLPQAVVGMLEAEAFSPDRYHVMSGCEARQRLAPLEPDLLGEAFVLEHLKPRLPQRKAHADRIRQLAWEVNAIEMWAFLGRVAYDFTSHETLPILALPPAQDLMQCVFWSEAAVSVTGAYALAGEPRLAEQCYGQLVALATSRSDPSSSEARTERIFFTRKQAEALVNLLCAHLEAGQVGQAEECYRDLARLAEGHPADAFLRQRQAQAASNVSVDYARRGRPGPIEEPYRELAALATSWPGEPGLREWLAAIGVNLVLAHANAGQPELAEPCYRDLARLAGDHSDEPALRQRQAEALFQLIDGYRKRGALPRAEEHHNDFARLIRFYDGEPALRKLFGMVAVNLISALCEAGKLEPAEARYGELARLAADYPREAHLRDYQARSACAVIRLLGDLGELRRAEQQCRELARLAESRPCEPTLRDWQADAALAFISSCASFCQLTPATREYQRLVRLARAHSGEAGLGVRRAYAAAKLISGYARAGEATSGYGRRHVLGRLAYLAEKRCRELAQSADEHLDERPLREAFGAGMANLITMRGNAGEFETAAASYRELARLAETHREDAALREAQAKAAYNLMDGHLAGGSFEAAHELYEDIAALVRSNPSEPDLREVQVNAVIAIINAYRLAGKPAAATAVYGDLARIAEEYPEEPGVREWHFIAAIRLLECHGDAGEVRTQALHDLEAFAAAPDWAALRARALEMVRIQAPSDPSAFT